MSALVDALARRIEAHGGTILVGQDVTTVERTAAGWTVRLAEHEHEPERGREHERAPGRSVASTVTAGTLCLAVPAEVAARLLGANAPEATAVLDRIAAHGSADVTIVALLVADARLDADPFGSGVLVTAERRDVGAKALTHTSAKWAHVRAALPDGHHVVRLSYGGTRALPAADDTGLVTAAAADVGRLLPGGAEPVRLLDAVLAHWRSALPRPVVGRAALTRTLAAVLATDPTLAIVGAAVGGNGLAGVVAQAHGEARRTLRTTEEDAG
jgi:oxygen-dependent protoporphyrinogen oxidase